MAHSISYINMEHFLKAAISISQLSTDPKTQVGVLFVRNGSIVSSGCNRIPDRLAVTSDRINVVETRSKFTEHAERSAVYAAARHGISLQGTTCISTLFPCIECARALIGCGAVELWSPAPDLLSGSKWTESWIISQNMLEEAGIKIVDTSG
jgi:dCMP deaminase